MSTVELKLHTRSYDVDVFRIDAGTLRIRGSVRDSKPPRLHFRNDPDELTIHRMIVDLVVDVGSMIITAVDVVFDSYPQTTCPRIIDHYQRLVGTSIGRGFTGGIREMFGGPRGCTHTNALLLAMAPVFIQSAWSLKVVNARENPVQVTMGPGGPASPDPADRPDWVATIDSCHVWASDGDMVRTLESSESGMVAPRAFVERAEALGIPEVAWRDQFH